MVDTLQSPSFIFPVFTRNIIQEVIQNYVYGYISDEQVLELSLFLKDKDIDNMLPVQCKMIFRDNNDPAIIRFNELWWKYYTTWSLERDQPAAIVALHEPCLQPCYVKKKDFDDVFSRKLEGKKLAAQNYRYFEQHTDPAAIVALCRKIADETGIPIARYVTLRDVAVWISNTPKMV